MSTESFDARFGGTRRLYGNEAVEKLRQSHVCVIGIGGVGSWAAEALARTAVGKITLIDLDDICVTNTNRQLHALADTIGRSKVEVIAERIAAINPDCECEVIEDFITADNIQELITGEFDYVLDAIDNFRVKAALIAHCKRNKIKIITTGGAGGQVDPTQIQIIDLAKTWHDPLARKVKTSFGINTALLKTPSVNLVWTVYSQPNRQNTLSPTEPFARPNRKPVAL